MLLKACLNGSRSREEHPAVPLTPEEIAREGAAAAAAGAGALHVHPRGPDGRETLEASVCGAVVEAVRESCPGVPVGLSTGQWIVGGTEARLEAISRWELQPDFVSVNVYEDGVAELCDLLDARGVRLEAGLATSLDVARMPHVEWLRVLVEVEERKADRAVACAAAVEAALDEAGMTAPQLHHGEGPPTWAVLARAMERGHDVRIGLEDTLVLPDGGRARDNAELVAAAVRLNRELRSAG